MSSRRGVPAPRNSFLETISTRFAAGTQSCFILGSTHKNMEFHHIVYCSDGFCKLTGFPRAQVMQKSCSCDFLYGEKTSQLEQGAIASSLNEKKEFHCGIYLYKKDGTEFRCLLDIVPITKQDADVLMFLVSLKQVVDNSDPYESEGEDPIPLQKLNGSTFHIDGHTEATPFTRMERRRSRAVLYNLEGQLGTAEKPRKSNYSSISNLFSGSDRKVLDHQFNYSKKRSKSIVLHYGTFRTLWDWLILLLALYISATVPFFASMKALPNNASSSLTNATIIPDRSPRFWVDIAVEWIFMLDIILNFRTTYVTSRGQLVTNPRQIALRYLKSNFIFDFVTAVPFDCISLLFTETSVPAISHIQYFKVVRICRILYIYWKYQLRTQYGYGVVFVSMCMFALIAHWAACVWFAIGWREFENSRDVGETEGPGENTFYDTFTPNPNAYIRIGWLFELGEAMNKPFYANQTGGPGTQSAYITSLYFSMSSLTSVGFGNVSANTDAEKLCSIILMVLGGLLHAVVFGHVTTIIQRRHEKECEFERRKRNLDLFLKKNRFERNLTRRLTEYFEFNWSLNAGVDENEVINQFPGDIQADIALHLHSELLNLPAFNKASVGCKRYASMHCTRRLVAPKEIFIHEGDLLEHVFVVCSGTLEVSRDDNVYAILSKGDLFGGDVTIEDVLISKVRVKAVTFCQLECISVKGMRSIVKLYTDQYEIAENIQNDYSCQLWDEISVNIHKYSPELRERRNTQIENWNKHYVDAETDDSHSTDSCVYFPGTTVNVETEDNQSYRHELSTSLNEDVEGNHTEFRTECNPMEIRQSHTLQVPVLYAGDSNFSSSAKTTPCPSPCLRSNDRRTCKKKRVSFNDISSPVKNDEAGIIAAFANEVFSADVAHLTEPFSSPESNSALKYAVNVGGCNKDEGPIQWYKPSSREEAIHKRDGLQSSPNRKEDERSIQGKRSSTSPGNCGELRRRRRRKKHNLKLERTSSSSSSSEENSTLFDHTRERKMSIVKPPAAYQSHSSPESRSSECEYRVATLEKKIDNLQSMVLKMSDNLQKVLDIHDHPRVKQQGDSRKDVDRCTDGRPTGNNQFSEQRSKPRQYLSTEVYDPAISQLNFIHTTGLLRSRAVSRSASQRMMSNNVRSDSSDQPLHCAMRRHNSAPSCFNQSSVLTNECELRRPVSTTYNYESNSEMDLIAYKSNSPAYHSLKIGENDTFGDVNSRSCADRADFQRDTQICGSGIPSIFSYPTAKDADSTAPEIGFINQSDNSLRPYDASHSCLPLISISDYDECMMYNKVKPKSPKRTPPIVEGAGFLEIPARRQTGGSESGYSTSSPSPDISCV